MTHLSSSEIYDKIPDVLRDIIYDYSTPPKLYISTTAELLEYSSEQPIKPVDRKKINLFAPNPRDFKNVFEYIDGVITVWYNIEMILNKDKLLKSGRIREFTSRDTIQLDTESGHKLAKSLVREDITPLEKMYGGLYSINDLEEALDPKTFSELFIRPTNIVTLFLGFEFELDDVDNPQNTYTIENLRIIEDVKINKIYHYRQDEKSNLIKEPLDTNLMLRSIKFIPLCQMVINEENQDTFMRIELELMDL